MTTIFQQTDASVAYIGASTSIIFGERVGHEWKFLACQVAQTQPDNAIVTPVGRLCVIGGTAGTVEVALDVDNSSIGYVHSFTTEAHNVTSWTIEGFAAPNNSARFEHQVNITSSDSGNRWFFFGCKEFNDTDTTQIAQVGFGGQFGVAYASGAGLVHNAGVDAFNWLWSAAGASVHGSMASVPRSESLSKTVYLLGMENTDSHGGTAGGFTPDAEFHVPWAASAAAPAASTFPSSALMTGTGVFLDQGKTIDKTLDDYTGTGELFDQKVMVLTDKLAVGTGALSNIQKTPNKNPNYAGTGVMLDQAKTITAGRNIAGTGVMTDQGKTVSKGAVHTGTGAVIFGAITTLIRAFVYAGTGAVSVLKSVSKGLVHAGTGVAAFVRNITFVNVLAYAGTGVSSVLKSVSKGLVYTGSGAVAIATQLAKVFTALFTGTGAATLQKNISKGLVYTGSGVSTLLKLITKGLVYVGSGAAAITAIAVLERAFTYVGTGVATVLKTVVKDPFQATGAGVATLLKTVQKLLVAVGSGISTILAEVAGAFDGVYTAVGTVVLTKIVQAKRLATGTGVASIASQITRAVALVYTGVGTALQKATTTTKAALQYVGTGVVTFTGQFAAVLSVVFVGTGLAVVQKVVDWTRNYTSTPTPTVGKDVTKDTFVNTGSGVMQSDEQFLAGGVPADDRSRWYVRMQNAFAWGRNLLTSGFSRRNR